MKTTQTLEFPGSPAFQLWDTEIIDPTGRQRGRAWSKIPWNGTLHGGPAQYIENQPVYAVSASRVAIEPGHTHHIPEENALTPAEVKFAAEYILGNFPSDIGAVNFRIKVQQDGKLVVAYLLLQGLIPNYFTLPWQIHYDIMTSGHRGLMVYKTN